MIRIITDSAADITLEEAKKLNVTIIPMRIRFGEEEYRDKYDLSEKAFYEKLVEEDTLPTTSQINPFTYEEVYEEVTKAGDEAVVITLSSELSGTYQNACIAKADYDNIYVVDSKNATVGEQCLVRQALSYVERGFSASEIAAMLTEEREHIQLLALLDTLEYLKKGGRISSIAAFAGGMLSIKPVVGVEEGKVVVLGKARGSKNGSNMLNELVEKTGGIDYSRPIVLGYTGIGTELLDKYVEDSRALWEGKADKLPRVCVGSTVGTHVGPGAIAVGFFSNIK